MKEIRCINEAIDIIGKDHQYVKDLEALGTLERNDIQSYIELRIITAALNEGWQPSFSEDELRFVPWFCLYDIEEAIKRHKIGILVDNGKSLMSYVGVNISDNYSRTMFPSHLCFKSREAAEYAAVHFIEKWADYLTMNP